MPFDSAAPTSDDLAHETDEVIAGFGLSPTRNNLLDMAAEMDRRLRVFAGGPRRAAQIAAELRRRALRLSPA